jgi:hypothetical protein
MTEQQKAEAYVRQDMVGKGNPRYKHGLTKHPLFEVWKSMLGRCGNPKDKNYFRYGGRGIIVCDRWKDFVNFLEDMGERPLGMTLERINNDSNYEPQNCRWATVKEQARNRRGQRLIEFNGETKCLSEWAEQYKIIPDTLASRLKAGMDITRALTMKRHEKRVSS